MKSLFEGVSIVVEMMYLATKSPAVRFVPAVAQQPAKTPSFGTKVSVVKFAG